MTPLSVKVSRAARDQVWEQVRFIARHSARNALAWEARVQRAMDGLAALPSHALDAEATRKLGSPTCKLVFERTYLIFYRVDLPAALVEVIWFRHGARLPRSDEP